MVFTYHPYEMFDTNGMELKGGTVGNTNYDAQIQMENPYAMTIITTMANGAEGYIPSQLGYTNGGYSTDITRFAPGTGETLVTDYLEILDKLEVLDEEKDAMLLGTLRQHSIECLRDGVCRDSATGGLRLSSSSNRTWVSKSVLTLYVMEKVLGVQLPEGMVQQTINWGLVSARELTVGDQIFSDTGKLGGAPYYPRIVTAAVWL